MTQFYNRSYREWLSSLPLFILLLIVILSGNGEKIHARLLYMGELVWQDYFILRGDIPLPVCDVNPDIELALDKLASDAGSQDEMDELFDDEPFDREAARISLESARQLCIEKHQFAQQNQARVTPAVIVFRTLETSIATISIIAYEKQRITLLLMIFICAFTCSVKQHHISFKPVTTVMDHKLSSAAQLLGNLLLLISAWSYRDSAFKSATVVEYPEIYTSLILGFAILTVISLIQFVKLPHDIKPGGRVVHALLSIPLYVIMAWCAAIYFFLFENHPAGLAIFFSLLFDQAGLFLNVGLYIWVGMLLKQTDLGELVFKVFTPWRMSPELLAFIAIVVMAVPTAYTGASGIIIIAMGGIVYRELRRVGARRQLALAATAMTGSAGVVLRPCLLVVLIAALNKEVVTDQLFYWGQKIFLTTAVVFFFYSYISKREKMRIAPPHEALKPFLKAVIPLLPYALIIIMISLAYNYLLNASIDEFSAPIILPVIMLGFIIYEKLLKHKSLDDSFKQKAQNFEYAVRTASSDSSVHIGALLLLMGLSFVIGGVIERSEILNVFPEHFGSIWITLGFLIVVLVGIGMIMDPFGAVVLVTSTVAQVAYNNGINPIHFWMITLVAFELGYLTPPVTLNHLLTKQMVGHDEVSKAALEGDTFWYRHEKILLPLVTMGTTLALVSIVPVLVTSW